MNKTLLLLIPCFLIFSCKKEQENLPRKSVGNINTISVIIDDQLWNGEVGESIRNKFASPVIGLEQEEPLFTINQYHAQLLEGFMINSRTIIVVKKENKTQFVIKENQYAAPQFVFHISGKTTGDILKIIEKNTSKIIQIIEEAEIVESQTIIKNSLMNSKTIKDSFKISLAIPSTYSVALRSTNFLWLKKEITSGNNNLLVYEVPLHSINSSSNSISNIIKTRDSIGNLYIHGTENDSQMITEEGYSPYVSKLKLSGNETFETKGTWEMKNDFMSGPFVNYAILDKQHNRIIVLEGFCYSPSKEHRDLMHELEAIIKSVVILN